MIVRLLAVLLLIVPALARADPASHVVRTLFVGIDDYHNAGDEAGFSKLKGAVNDALLAKATLRAVYGWGIDGEGRPAQCPTATPDATTRAITLIDGCATHEAVLNALTGLIAVSAPGDTVLFYFAGHGAQIDVGAWNTKASGKNDTILTVDSRQPDDPVYKDEIVDKVLDVIIENARNVQGANVITIFDSCNSGSADRDADSDTGRSAPTVSVATLAQPIPTLLPPSAPLIGHRAHLAAASDGQTAVERRFADGTVHGLFTKAFVETITAHPDYTLADILSAVRAAVAAMGSHQNPVGDGLLMTLDGRSTAGVLIGAHATRGTVMLNDGRLGNVTAGSRFALYPDWTSARAAARPPLATGTVQSVTADAATLLLDTPPAAPLATDPVAREISHAFGSNRVTVGLDVYDANAVKVLAALPCARIGANPEVMLGPDTAGWAARVVQGPVIGHMPRPDDPAFATTLCTVLGPRARIDALVTLANAAGDTDLALCVSNAFYYRIPGLRCPEPQPLHIDAVAHLALTNLAHVARIITIFAIAPDNTVALLTQQDAPLPPGHVLALDFQPLEAGPARLLVLATDKPIDSAALEQQGGTRDPATCTTLLARLLCEANSGTRDAARSRIDDWAGMVATVAVTGGN